MASCSRCPLSRSKAIGACIWGKGNKNANVVIVGEGPGAVECSMGEPWVGEAGAILNWLIARTDIVGDYRDRYKTIYFTNATRCSPSTSDENQKQDISTDTLKFCRPYLIKQLKGVRPKYIITLGSPAYRSITKKWSENVTDVRGFWEYCDEFGAWVLPTVHPAAVLRNPNETSAALKDFELAADGIKNGVPDWKLGKYRTIKTLDEAKRLFERMKGSSLVAFDTETTSLNFSDPNENIIGYSFSYKIGTGFWLPLLGQNRVRIWTKKELFFIRKMLSRFLSDPDIPKVGQNVKYDINWTRAELGAKVRGIVHDTMQFHHLVDETTPTNLTYLLSYYRVGLPRYDQEIASYFNKNAKKKDYTLVPTSVLATYAAADADATLRVAYAQKPYRNRRRTFLYNEVSQPLSILLGAMERHGAMIDIPRIGEMEKKYDKEIQDKAKILAKMVKKPNFNPHPSSKDVPKLLFETLKLPVVGKTKSGKPSTDKRAKELWRRKFSNKKRIIKVLNLLAELGKMGKMKSTYLTGFRKLVDANDRVHTSYLSTGTVTGRPASKAPNVMNIPRDPTFRSLFIAGPGRKLIIADYSQVEARLIAYLAKETKQIERFMDPEFDIHTFNSASYRGKEESEVEKEERSYDKAITFGINYGRSAKTIAEEYEFSVREVQERIDRYFDTFVKIKKFRQRSIRTSKQKLYLTNEIGRRRHFLAYEWIYSDMMEDAVNNREDAGLGGGSLYATVGGLERQAINFPIQSYAHDLLVIAGYKIWKELKRRKLDAFPVLEVYDCLIFDAAEECSEETARIVNELMPVKKTLDDGREMVFPADAEISDHWEQ